MSELIEADFEGQSDSESIVAYQYSDLQNTAKSILSKATEIANNKIERAKKNIFELEEKMRQQGYDKGFAQGVEAGEAEGRKNGEAAARAEFEAKVGGLNGALQHILGELNFRKQSIQAQAEADLLALSLEIARKIVKREVEVDEKFVVPLVMEAIALTNNRNDLMIKVNPDDHKVIEEEIPTLEAIFNDIGRVSISDDESIQKGGVRVSSRDGDVDLSLAEQFDTLEKALVGDTEGMEEWDGQPNTPMPGVQEVETPVAAELPAAEPEAPVSQPETPSNPVETSQKPKVEPVRRRGPRNNGDDSPAATDNGGVSAPESPAVDSDIPSETGAAVPAEVDSQVQSSLSGVTDLASFTLSSDEEAVIKEIVESNVGDGDA